MFAFLCEGITEDEMCWVAIRWQFCQERRGILPCLWGFPMLCRSLVSSSAIATLSWIHYPLLRSEEPKLHPPVRLWQYFPSFLLGSCYLVCDFKDSRRDHLHSGFCFFFLNYYYFYFIEKCCVEQLVVIIRGWWVWSLLALIIPAM